MAPAWGDPVRAPWQLVVRKGTLQGLLTVRALGPGIRNAKTLLGPSRDLRKQSITEGKPLYGAAKNSFMAKCMRSA